MILCFSQITLLFTGWENYQHFRDFILSMQKKFFPMADYNLSSALPSPFPKRKGKGMEKHQHPAPKITPTEDMSYKKKEKIRKIKGKEEDYIPLVRPRTTFEKYSSLPSSLLPLLSAPKCFVFYAVGRLREKKRTL